MPNPGSNSAVRVYDPRGVVEAVAVPVAARVASLTGTRLGVLDNTKWNANRLLQRTTAKLQENHEFASVTYYRKESFSKAAAAELVDEIARDNDIVLTAIGD